MEFTSPKGREKYERLNTPDREDINSLAVQDRAAALEALSLFPTPDGLGSEPVRTAISRLTLMEQKVETLFKSYEDSFNLVCEHAVVLMGIILKKNNDISDSEAKLKAATFLVQELQSKLQSSSTKISDLEAEIQSLSESANQNRLDKDTSGKILEQKRLECECLKTEMSTLSKQKEILETKYKLSVRANAQLKAAKVKTDEQRQQLLLKSASLESVLFSVSQAALNNESLSNVLSHPLVQEDEIVRDSCNGLNSKMQVLNEKRREVLADLTNSSDHAHESRSPSLLPTVTNALDPSFVLASSPISADGLYKGGDALSAVNEGGEGSTTPPWLNEATERARRYSKVLPSPFESLGGQDAVVSAPNSAELVAAGVTSSGSVFPDGLVQDLKDVTIQEVPPTRDVSSASTSSRHEFGLNKERERRNLIKSLNTDRQKGGTFNNELFLSLRNYYDLSNNTSLLAESSLITADIKLFCDFVSENVGQGAFTMESEQLAATIKSYLQPDGSL